MYIRQSTIFTKTTKEAPKDEVSHNAELLTRAGFVHKEMAGVYSYLPYGLRVLRRIEGIIREEMNALGASEILMPALTPKEPWVKTGRWDGLDVLFRLEGAGNKEYALGATHEEIVTPMLQDFVQSYKDLPRAVYQIQNKFRNEPRAKSGLLRGREFLMKDLYSFHATQEELDAYYMEAARAYDRIYARCGLDAKMVEASGGTFSKFSHEYQVFTEFGEDLVYHCAKCGWYKNREILTTFDTCDTCQGPVTENKAIEVGNIFPLGAKYSNAFDFTFVDADGKSQPVLMGCYGIGPSRVMGTIVEVHHDAAGMIWPAEVAPFAVHVVALSTDESVMRKAQEIALTLSEHGVEVLLDDRDMRAGEKFAESDLIGIPTRVVVSSKQLAAGTVEWKSRTSATAETIDESTLYSRLTV
ncbi:MAG: aminoacyl--tRNA ligase-related protein [Patescibacteria group bacterium]